MPDTKLILIVEETEQRAGRFHAMLDGRRLCTSRTPLLSAARALQTEGVPARTPLAMRHNGSAIVSLRTTVVAAAGLIVSERDRDIPRFEPWKATPAFAEGSNSAAEAAEAAE